MPNGNQAFETTAFATLIVGSITLIIYLVKSFLPSQQKTMNQASSAMGQAAGFAQEIAKTALEGMKNSAEAMHKMALQIDELREETRQHARENREHHQELLDSLTETRDLVVREFQQMEEKLNGRKSWRSRSSSH